MDHKVGAAKDPVVASPIFSNSQNSMTSPEQESGKHESAYLKPTVDVSPGTDCLSNSIGKPLSTSSEFLRLQRFIQEECVFRDGVNIIRNGVDDLELMV